MAEVGMAVAGTAANAAGAALSPSGKAPELTYSTPGFITTMNNMLQGALNNAIGTSTNYTNQAIGQQNQSLNTATNALNTGLSGATQSALQQAQNGFNTSQALQAPYAGAGYGALDAYQDSLGLSRPQMGSQALSSALTNTANVQNQLQNLFSQYGTTPPTAPGAAPTGPQDLSYYSQQVTPQQVQQYLAQNTKQNWNNGVASLQYTGANAPNFAGKSGAMGWNPAQQSELNSVAQNYLAQQAYNQAQQQYQQQLNQYNNQLNTYNSYNKALSSINYNPQQAQIAAAYNQGLFSKPGAQ